MVRHGPPWSAMSPTASATAVAAPGRCGPVLPAQFAGSHQSRPCCGQECRGQLPSRHVLAAREWPRPPQLSSAASARHCGDYCRCHRHCHHQRHRRRHCHCLQVITLYSLSAQTLTSAAGWHWIIDASDGHGNRPVAVRELRMALRKKHWRKTSGTVLVIDCRQRLGALTQHASNSRYANACAGVTIWVRHIRARQPWVSRTHSHRYRHRQMWLCHRLQQDVPECHNHARPRSLGRCCCCCCSTLLLCVFVTNFVCVRRLGNPSRDGEP